MTQTTEARSRRSGLSWYDWITWPKSKASIPQSLSIYSFLGIFFFSFLNLLKEILSHAYASWCEIHHYWNDVPSNSRREEWALFENLQGMRSGYRWGNITITIALFLQKKKRKTPWLTRFHFGNRRLCMNPTTRANASLTARGRASEILGNSSPKMLVELSQYWVSLSMNGLRVLWDPTDERTPTAMHLPCPISRCKWCSGNLTVHDFLRPLSWPQLLP